MRALSTHRLTKPLQNGYPQNVNGLISVKQCILTNTKEHADIHTTPACGHFILLKNFNIVPVSSLAPSPFS